MDIIRRMCSMSPPVRLIYIDATLSDFYFWGHLVYAEKNQSAAQRREGVIDALNTIIVNTTRCVAENVNHVCISASITL
jgi:hypothetical protein